MAKPPAFDDQTSPEDLSPTTPRDLHATSDIRFVMMEVGKLSTKVDRLIDDVKGHGSKIDHLRITIATAAGGIAVVAFIFTVLTKSIPVPHISFDASPQAPAKSAK